MGQEVVPEGKRVLERAGQKYNFTCAFLDFDWGAEYYFAHGRMMPQNALDLLRPFDAIYLGAVGHPDIPDHVTLNGLLLPIRRTFDQYVNVRPAILYEGVASPLAGRKGGDIDMVIVRENTEGEYAGVGGIAHRGLESEVGIETGVFTRAGIERIVRYAFELASSRRGVLTSATKSNASRFGYVLWDEIVEEAAGDFPGVRVERVLVDALAARMVRAPDSLDVVVASNLFADILTDLGAAIQGGMGMAASANLAPGTGPIGIFEPVHGSAPDLAGRDVANPAGAIWSASLMLEHLGEADAAARLLDGLATVCCKGPRTRDVGGSATTREVGDAVAAQVGSRAANRSA